MALVVALALTLLLGATGASRADEAPASGAGPGSPGNGPADRHAAAGGCFAVGRVDGAGAGVGPFAAPLRFVATDLGQYLLVEPGGEVLAAGDRGVVRVEAPSTAAEWVLLGPDGGAFTLRTAVGGRTLEVRGDGSTRLGAGPATPLHLRPAQGCAIWPDVDTGVTGPHLRGGSPIDEVQGYVDAHVHLTAFEFLGGRVHCGRPWHPYGVAYALRDCPDHALAQGRAALVENLTGSGDLLAAHDPVGWPTFRDWPAPRSLTHEQTYHRWVERAWRGGLRLLVNLATDNRVLCEVWPAKRNPCNEMASVRLQAQQLHQLERYVDAQHGGPGKGWLRIVGDPAEARRVMNEGRLAVVLGVEISEPFGCRAILDQSQCTEEQVEQGLDELVDLGVRHLFLVHKFDNAFGGVKGDRGTSGLLTNPGNVGSTGHLIDMRTCAPGAVPDNAQDLPIYGPPPHCNVRGATPLGLMAVDAVADRGLLLDVDHMSATTRDAVLDRLEARGYAGVVSSHGWADEPSLPRVLGLGGFVAGIAADSDDFVEYWRTVRQHVPEGRFFGFGYGADSNGLAGQGRARRGPDPVRYPFTGLGGTTIDRQVTGERTFDVTVDGVAHYGLYPDWIEDMRLLAGDAVVADLARGAEAYLRTWERATGIPSSPDGCLAAGAREQLRPGLAPEEVLAVAGQPRRRTASAFVYCDAVVRFDDGLRSVAVDEPVQAQSAPGLAAAVHHGAAAAARRAAPALWS